MEKQQQKEESIETKKMEKEIEEKERQHVEEKQAVGKLYPEIEGDKRSEKSDTSSEAESTQGFWQGKAVMSDEEDESIDWDSSSSSSNSEGSSDSEEEINRLKWTKGGSMAKEKEDIQSHIEDEQDILENTLTKYEMRDLITTAIAEFISKDGNSTEYGDSIDEMTKKMEYMQQLASTKIEMVKDSLVKSFTKKTKVTKSLDNLQNIKGSKQVEEGVRNILNEKKVKLYMAKYYRPKTLNAKKESERVIQEIEEVMKTIDTQIVPYTSSELLKVSNITEKNAGLPENARVDIDKWIAKLLSNKITDYAAAHALIRNMRGPIVDNLDNILIRKLVADITVAKRERQQQMIFQTNGKIKIQDRSILVQSAEGEFNEAYRLNSSTLLPVVTNVQKDGFIDQILAASRIVVMDMDNIRKAMKLSNEQIVKFIEYLESWGVNTIQVEKDRRTSTQIATTCVTIDRHIHDDIPMLVIASVQKAWLMTSDKHSEFKDMYTVCTKHKTLQTRKNETCQHDHKNTCTYIALASRPAGKFAVTGVGIQNGKIKSIKANSSIPGPWRMDLTKKMSTYRVKMREKENIITDCRWSLTLGLASGPLTATSTKVSTLEEPITSVSISADTTNVTVTGDDKVTALVAAITAAGTEAVQQIKERTSLKLAVTNKIIYLVTKDRNISVAYTASSSIDSNLYSEAANTITCKAFSSVMRTEGINIQLVKQASVVKNEMVIDLAKSTLVINEFLLSNNLAIIQYRANEYIVEITDQMAQALITGAIRYVKEIAEDKNRYMAILPLTMPMREAITRFYTSKDLTSEQEGQSYDVASTNKKFVKGLSRYFMDVDADRPSSQLIAAPSTVDFVQSTAGLKIEESNEGESVLTYIDKPVNVEYMRGGIASYLYTQWQEHADDAKQIHVYAVHWDVQSVRSINCSKKDIQAVKYAIDDPVSRVISDVTADILNTFQQLVSGFDDIRLPPILRGTKMPALQARGGKSIFLQVDYALPTCGVIVRIKAAEDPQNSYMIVCVSVSPPITYNYISLMLGSDNFLTNEYNMVMCEQVEMETYGLFDYIATKMDYMAEYFAAYGVWSMGLKMLGMDPIKVIMASSSIIEHGTTDVVTVMTEYQLPSMNEYLNVEDFIIAISQGKMNVILKLRMINTVWMKHKDVHVGIKRLINKSEELTPLEFMVAYKTFCAICGVSEINEHLKLCFAMKKASSPMDMQAICKTRLKNEQLRKTKEKCVRLTKVYRDYYTSLQVKSLPSGLTVSDKNAVVKFDPISAEGMRNMLARSDYYHVVDRIPTAGFVRLYKILIRNKRVKANQRYRVIEKIVKQKHSLSIEHKTIMIANEKELPTAIKTTIEQSAIRGCNAVILNYDEAGAHYKRLQPNEKLPLEMPKWMTLYIPDELLYNAVNRDIQVNETEVDVDPITMATDEEMNSGTQGGMPDMGRLTMSGTKKFWAKVASCVLVAVVMFYFWPFTMLLLLLPAMMLAYVFPQKEIMTTVSKWYGLRSVQTVQLLPYGRLMVWTGRVLNVAWWVTLTVGTVKLLRWYFN